MIARIRLAIKAKKQNVKNLDEYLLVLHWSKGKRSTSRSGIVAAIAPISKPLFPVSLSLIQANVVAPNRACVTESNIIVLKTYHAHRPQIRPRLCPNSSLQNILFAYLKAIRIA